MDYYKRKDIEIYDTELMGYGIKANEEIKAGDILLEVKIKNMITDQNLNFNMFFQTTLSL